MGGSSNTAVAPDCCECEGTTSVKIKKNGPRSRNKAFVGNLSWTSTTQINDADLGVALLQATNTGRNRANRNTRGNTRIRTGKAKNSFNLMVKPSKNKI